jgi:isocitrate dehydrogenase
VTRHYREHQKGLETSTNPVASIFAWTRALAKRGALDRTPELVAWAELLEQAVIGAVDDGAMTKDLALACGHRERDAWLTTSQFMEVIQTRLESNIENTRTDSRGSESAG